MQKLILNSESEGLYQVTFVSVDVMMNRATLQEMTCIYTDLMAQRKALGHNFPESHKLTPSRPLREGWENFDLRNIQGVEAFTLSLRGVCWLASVEEMQPLVEACAIPFLAKNFTNDFIKLLRTNEHLLADQDTTDA